MHMTNGELVDALADARGLVASLEHEIASREARRLLAATEAYRELCKANGLLYGFEKIVETRRANGQSPTPAQRAKIAAMSKLDLEAIFG